MTPNELTQLMSHMDWADALVWHASLALPGARTDNRIRDLLYHTHSVHHAYMQLLRGEPLEVRDIATFDGLPALCKWAQECHARIAEFMADVDRGALDREIEFPWADALIERFGRARPATVGQCILQLALHTSHHRGQICTRIRELGGDPPLTDFIAWLWLGQPAPEWSGGPRAEAASEAEA